MDDKLNQGETAVQLLPHHATPPNNKIEIHIHHG
jgi:hypothetical protein